jgi:hypothetical protein
VRQRDRPGENHSRLQLVYRHLEHNRLKARMGTGNRRPHRYRQRTASEGGIRKPRQNASAQHKASSNPPRWSALSARGGQTAHAPWDFGPPMRFPPRVPDGADCRPARPKVSSAVPVDSPTARTPSSESVIRPGRAVQHAVTANAEA